MDAVFSNSFGELTSAGDNTISNKIYRYVLIMLSSLTVAKNENENAITNRLCIELNTRRPRIPFYFHHQNIENAKLGTSTDFAVLALFLLPERLFALFELGLNDRYNFRSTVTSPFNRKI